VDGCFLTDVGCWFVAVTGRTWAMFVDMGHQVSSAFLLRCAPGAVPLRVGL